MRIYNKDYRNKKSTNIVSLLIFTLVFSFTFCLVFGEGGHPNFNDSAEALTSTTVNSAYKAGGGEEMWSGTSFNPLVINDLRTKLFGTEDPVSYIKTNGAGDYNSYGKNSPNAAEKGTPYYVVPATTINSKITNPNPNHGMVVKLGGKDWMVASLTLDNNENVVMTLYLAGSSGVSKFYTQTANTKGNNAYSRSDIRIHLKTDSNWSLYNSADFGSRFLVQPKNIQYQRTESLYGRPKPTYGSNINLLNDALGLLTSNNTSGFDYYKPFGYL